MNGPSFVGSAAVVPPASPLAPELDVVDPLAPLDDVELAPLEEAPVVPELDPGDASSEPLQATRTPRTAEIEAKTRGCARKGKPPRAEVYGQNR